MSHSTLDYRRSENEAAQSEIFDVAIIGAGVIGACLFHQLRKKGYRVLLTDKADFAGGTSQASAMMLWGGLAYLRSFDLATVARLSFSREALVRRGNSCASPRRFRYIVGSPQAGNRAIVQSALYLYWLLGAFRRTRPRWLNDFDESRLLKATDRNCFEYEEAYVADSDARFVLQWILRSRDIGNPALNYCTLHGGRFDSSAKLWILDLEDRVLGRQVATRARLVVNAAGVWTDSLNKQFGIETPYHHILSKGVFLGLRRDPAQNTALIVEKADQDCYALIPWGPVSLWGPTETFTSSPQDGFSITAEDIHSLVQEYDRHFARPFRPEDVISLRCGVRGLAVPRSTRHDLSHSQSLSRKYVIQRDRELPWISIHGGKLTSCSSIAEAAAKTIGYSTRPSLLPRPFAEFVEESSERESFPGLAEEVPSARSCADESCWSLDDYLRRRTNISQWIPRGGLGRFNENLEHLARLSGTFAATSSFNPQTAVRAYQREIETRFDRVLLESFSTPAVEGL
jgi:glycerol-3-phosphate dehydrogenase